MSPDHNGLPALAESGSAPSSNLAEEIATQVLELLRALLQELGPSVRGTVTVTLDSHVDRDLALDSLVRTELLCRIEDQFQVHLGEQILLAETPRDLVDLILKASSGRDLVDLILKASSGPEPVALAADWQALTLEPLATGTPDRTETLIELLDWHVVAHPDRLAIRIYGNDDRIDTTFNYAGLRQGAQVVAAGLQKRGLQPGQTAP